METPTTSDSVPNAPSSPQQPRNQRSPRGPFDQNRRGARDGGRGRGGPHGERGRGGSNRGRGRGVDGRQHQDHRNPRDGVRQAPKGDISEAQPNAQNTTATGESTEDNQAKGAEDDVEAEVCFICASPVVHNSVAPCNHRTCHICALRMRALYKNKACMHCRVSIWCFLSTQRENSKHYPINMRSMTDI